MIKLKYTIFIFSFIFLYNTSFSYYSQEQLESYQQTFQYGMQAQITKILDNFKFNLETNKIQAEVINLFKELFHNTTDTKILQSAVFIIGEKEIKELSQELIDLVKEIKDPQTKADALRALGKMKNTTITPIIEDILTSQDIDTVKEQAVFVLGKLKEPSLNLHLQEIIKTSDNKALLENTLTALSEIKDPSTFDSLKEFFDNNTSNFLKSKAALSISSLNTPSSNAWLGDHLSIESDSQVQISMIQGYIETGGDLNNFLKEYNAALKNADDTVRKAAISMIPKSGYKNAVPFLEYTILNDLKEEMKEEAAVAFITLDSAKAFQFFKKNIEKGSNYTQVAIIEALKKEKDKKKEILSELLSPLFRSTNNTYIQSNLVSLAANNLDIKASESFLMHDVLENKTGDTNFQSFKVIAIKALSSKNYTQTLPRLINILDNPSDKELNSLFKTALKTITYSKKEAEKQYIKMMENLYQQPYSRLQRSDLYLQVELIKPLNIEKLLSKNYAKEVDPQTKFQLKRLLKTYGIIKP